MQLGSFGNIIFKVSNETVHTLSNLKRTVKGRYAVHDIISKKPKLEFLGPDLCDVSFDMYLYASLGVNPRDYIIKMYNLVHTGEAHRLNLGRHRFGKYVMEEVSEDWVSYMKDGNLIYLRSSVKLKEYD